MSEPDSGEYSVRSLAEILREHGLETELGTRPGRRRRTSDDPEVTGRSPRVEPAVRAPRPGTTPPAAPAPAARNAPPARGPAPAAGGTRTPPAAPATPQVRHPAPSWADEPAASRPAAGLAGPVTPPREPARDPAPVRPAAPARAEPGDREDQADRLSSTGRVGGRTDRAPLRPTRRKSDRDTPTGDTPSAAGGPTTSAIPAAAAAAAAARRREAHPVTGPIPVQRPAEPAQDVDDEPLTGRESALAWARFAGELVVALAVGIGLYFGFTVLWELMPYVALVAAPVAVTGLVAGVAAWRRKTGQGELGVRLLGLLVLAGTVLVIAPAAGLLAA
ncbi:hypothetical protein [Modestobacter versicolor]|uniref:hypothetical protein n=1 Tax=Modestobacter versicolor TaxID=429133 RepID=UPI0034DF8C8C